MWNTEVLTGSHVHSLNIYGLPIKGQALISICFWTRKGRSHENKTFPYSMENASDDINPRALWWHTSGGNGLQPSEEGEEGMEPIQECH